MTRIPVNGVHLNVEVAGDGPPLILLHGFTGSAETWSPFVPRLATIRRVVAVDLLGHGLSDSPPDPDRYRIERCLEDLAMLLDRLAIDRFDLLGYSMGGRLALHLALALPDRVDELVLESASPGIHGPKERAERIHRDENLVGMLEGEGLEPFVDYWERLPLFASQARLDPAIRQQLRQQRLAGNAVGLAGSLRGMGAGRLEPLFRRLGEIDSALLIVGELDEQYCRLAGLIARAIPAAKVAVVPDAGHAVHLEQPDVFGELVMDYLREGTNRDGSVGEGSRLHRHQVRAR